MGMNIDSYVELGTNIVNNLAAKTTLVAADVLPLLDSADATAKKITATNLVAQIMALASAFPVELDTAITGYSAPNATIGAPEYGKTLITTAAFTAKLPNAAAAAGTWLRIINCVDADLIVTTVGGTGILIADGSLAGKTCTWSTSSHKIGACALIISNGSAWVVINQSSAAIVMVV
jgi:hypothetical protein